MALKDLKSELTQVRSETSCIFGGGKCSEDTIKANQVGSRGDKGHEIIILEHEVEETTMDC